MKEFFGFGDYTREIEGYMSWQHLVFVSSLMVVMITFAVILGVKNKNRDLKIKNKVLIWSAIFIDSFEIFKLIILCIRDGSVSILLNNLPLFLCSIQLITIPLAAFAKGKVKESALDFVFIFGILGAILGTYTAGQNYSNYPVLSFDNVVSGITHTIAGFTSLYIGISGMASMKRENILITFAILFSFGITAYIANILLDYNYMFLMRGDGTPYDILYNIVEGNKILYPTMVMGLFVIYVSLFYLIFFLIKRKKQKNK